MHAGIESLSYRSLPDCRRATTCPLDLSIGFIIHRVLIYFNQIINFIFENYNLRANEFVINRMCVMKTQNRLDCACKCGWFSCAYIFKFQLRNKVALLVIKPLSIISQLSFIKARFVGGFVFVLSLIWPLFYVLYSFFQLFDFVVLFSFFLRKQLISGSWSNLN